MTVAQQFTGFTQQCTVAWERLPDNFQLPDDPVENIKHPYLAAALTEALEIAGYITPTMLIASNFGICAKIVGKTVVKAPDWFYVPAIWSLDGEDIDKSYTPYAQGEPPLVVMEFLSDADGHEYSSRPVYPYGKLYFYEQILRSQTYVIFDPASLLFEVRRLYQGHYELQQPDENGRYWIESMRLFLGIWHGTKAQRTFYWLRWWDEAGNLLPWGAERVLQEQQQVDQERQRAEQERQRAERLAALLREQGIDPGQ
jgi:Uma2 family endonuclease